MSAIAEPVEYRTLPHSLEAEKAVIGSILAHQELLEDVSSLRPEHFFRKIHQTIFAAILKLSERREAIDGLMLKDALATAGELDEVGGAAYVYGLSDGIPKMSNVADYAALVRSKFDLRQVIIAGQEMARRAYEADEDAKDVVDAAEQAIFKISQGDSQAGFRRLSEILPEAMDQIEAWCKSGTGVSGMPSGLSDLDAMTRGFQPSNLIIIAARPGCGKTALIMNIAQHVARSGNTVGIFSLEMSEIDLAIRALTGEAGIDSHRLQSGHIREREWSTLAHAIGNLSNDNLFVDPSPMITVFEMRSRARRLKSKHGLDLLIVDYTQLMQSHDKERRENRTLELSAITRALKVMAKEFNIPVIALSQLSRKLEDRADKKPMLSDLRESGSLEQDADVVLFIHHESMFSDAPEHKGIAEIIIGKQRNGPRGTVKVGWLEDQTKFVNLAPPERYVGSLPAGDR